MLYFEAPRVATVSASAVDDTLRDEIVDLWVRVNDAGGSVGFLPGAPRVAVAAALERHLDDLRGGRSLLCVLREPAGPLRGLGLWEHDRGFPFEHVAGLKRLMVDPALQGRNLGRILLGAMVGIARRELPHVELLRLDYRDGLGLGEFYARAGWTEVGRHPARPQADRDRLPRRRRDGAPGRRAAAALTSGRCADSRHDRPVMKPSSVRSMRSALGDFGRPGIVRMSPQIA